MFVNNIKWVRRTPKKAKTLFYLEDRWHTCDCFTIPGRSFRPSETAPYTAGNGYKTAKILPETAKNWRRFSPFLGRNPSFQIT
jgi:hypothetical protein